MRLKQDCGADTGISTLILFIAIVLMAALVVVPLINTSSMFTEKAVHTGKETKEHVGTGIRIMSVGGQTTDNTITDHGITRLTILIEPLAGSEIITLDTMIISVVSTGKPPVILNYNQTSDSYADGCFNASRWLRIGDGTKADRINDPHLEYGDIVELGIDTTSSATDFSPNVGIVLEFLVETGFDAKVEFRTPLMYPVSDEYLELY
ncbi:MAG: hypothetical protein EF813_01800 [Methanosarcinales archaeon]|nr:MAG: hypothetical protein EF813_01800 [Methanosarcinales archaeon]